MRRDRHRSSPKYGYYFNPRTPCGVRRRRCFGGADQLHFNPRTPCGVRPRLTSSGRSASTFQSTHPLRGATAENRIAHSPAWDFNPRTPCGVRPCACAICPRPIIFQSTHPLRGATAQEAAELARHIISIHAPLAGCDENSDVVPRPNEISIHAPLAGCDRRRDFLLSQAGAFQSTHPLRGATQRIHEQMVLRAFQSTHPLRGATGRKRYVPSAVSVFQSTHPLRGATNGCGHGLSCPAGFQSTHPLRGATDPAHAADCNKKISIHAPLAGCDRSARSTETRMDDFNPRTPCGVRLMHGRALLEMNEFQSTHPLRGATATVAQHPAGTSTFQSTHPLRGATQENRRALRHLPISIHAPLAGCDFAIVLVLRYFLHFNPRTPCGVRPSKERRCIIFARFQSTHPLRGATHPDRHPRRD